MDPTQATQLIADGTAGIGGGNAAASALDFTVWSLFMRADMVVKAVMIGLIFASVWSWGIVFEKWIRFGRVNRQADAFERLFWSGKSLDEIFDEVSARPSNPLALLFVSAMREWKRSSDMTAHFAGLKERIDKVMGVTIGREMLALENRLLFLATVGSVAPFIGLFGTVWGIMNSFQSIAISRDTNLAVVAPGIAEALFATALGLLAAIPAVIAYNKFSSDVSRLGSRLDGFADEFSAIVSRQLDERS